MTGTIICGLVIVALLVERYFSNRAHTAETARLTNAVIAKTAGELHMLDEFWRTPAPPDPGARQGPPASSVPDGFTGIAGLD